MGGLVSIPRPMCFFLFYYFVRDLGKKNPEKDRKSAESPPHPQKVTKLVMFYLVLFWFCLSNYLEKNNLDLFLGSCFFPLQVQIGLWGRYDTIKPK